MNDTNGYWDADALLHACTHLAEKELVYAGKKVHIRELSASQRLAANEAAVKANPDEPDNALYRAIIVQCGVIDPVTKAPLFPPSAAPLLAQGREQPIRYLASEILQLSEALPSDLFRGDPAPDDGQPDTETGVEAGGEAER